MNHFVPLSTYIESLEKQLVELHESITKEKGTTDAQTLGALQAAVAGNAPQFSHRNRSAFEIYKSERMSVAKQDWKVIGKEWKEMGPDDRLPYMQSSEAEKENNMQHGSCAKVDLVYKTIRAATGKLGGNGAGGAIYGEVTKGGFASTVQYMKENCQWQWY